MLGFLSEGQIALLIPIIALCVPIVAILTRHQRDMAQAIHGNVESSALLQEIQNLRQEVASLRQMVTQQALQMDDLRQRSLMQSPPTVASYNPSMGQQVQQ